MQYKKDEEKTYTKRTEEVPRLSDGQVGIRATLRNMGYSDDSIGFNDSTGTVTLNGREFMKPGYLDDDAGVSYANEKDIQKSLVNFYSNTSNPVVRVSDAFASYGGKYGATADALGYSNGNVMAGGSPVDILYIDDEGKAWARQNSVRDAAEKYAGDTGLQSPLELAKLYEERYLSKASSLADKLNNRKSFSYDPENDPVFLAYRNKYRLEGDRAAENSMAAYSAQTGGYTNSAAATAAAQAAQYYAKKLTDTIPELAQQAYNRYNTEYQNRLNLLNSMVDIYDTAYRNAAGANNRQQSNAAYSARSNVDRDNAERDRRDKERQTEWEELFNKQKYEKNARDSYWDEVFNTQNITKNEYTNEGLRLSNAQKEIYRQYYRQLLQAELSESRINNELTRAKINSMR